MIDKKDVPSQESPLKLDEMVDGVLSPSGIGDTCNNFQWVLLCLDGPDLWRKVKPVKTYAGYMNAKYESYPDLAGAVVRRSDRLFVQAYDGLVQKINEAIGEGIASEEQASKVGKLIREANELIASQCDKLARDITSP